MIAFVLKFFCIFHSTFHVLVNESLFLVALLSLALSELALRISSLFVSFCRNFSQDPVVLQTLRFNLDRLARIVLVVQALGEYVRQFS